MRTTIFSTLCINLHLLSGGHAFTASPSQRVVRPFATAAIRSTVEASSEPSSTVEASSEASTTTPSAPAIDSTPAPAEASTTPAAEASATPATEASTPAASSSSDSNDATWEVKQHLYGLDMIKAAEAESGTVSVTMDADGGVAGGDALPLPQTYITCGKCKSLFAIADADLGEKGKGCRVKCSVCDNSWYQSRDRLFDIPTETHDILPANKSDLDRIARNLARDIPPAFFGVNKLYVGNLDFRTTPDELLDFFESKSEGDVSVCDVSIVKGPDGRSRGFAFVSFYNEKDGKAALECNGLECNGRELLVNETNN